MVYYLDVLANQQIYDLILPFVLIFLVVFSILRFGKFLSSNLGVNLIISISVALMAIRFGLVAWFYREIFYRFGGILLISIVFLVLGFVIVPERWRRVYMFILGFLVLVAMGIGIFNSFSVLGWTPGIFWENYISLFIIIGLIVLVIGWVLYGRRSRIVRTTR